MYVQINEGSKIINNFGMLEAKLINEQTKFNQIT
jgi:hypothetical protein